MKKPLFFTSTMSGMPAKAIRDKRLYESLSENQQILPRHPQLSITNTCNLNCPFCSFKDRDKTKGLSFEEVKEIINMFIQLEMRALTLTGGGEPLCHPKINEILSFCREKSADVSLITNGFLLEELDTESLKALTWCRVSFDDSKSAEDAEHIAEILRKVCPKAPTVDWSFSYVVLEKQNIEIQSKIISLAESLNMLNVRFCPDQNNTKKVNLNLTIENNKNRDICIYDSKPEKDVFPECWVYLLKPFVAADGNIYPCCCSQYYSDKKDFQEDDKICFYKDFGKKLYSMEAFQPKCRKCFFSHYNEYFNIFLNTIKHEKYE